MDRIVPSPLTTDPVAIPTNAVLPQKPEFIRLPKPRTRCPWAGLSRATISELLQANGGKVKSVYLRKRGCIRGIRLVHLQSLLDYLHDQIEE